MKKGKAYIGTSGWSYPHWGKGVFYPKSVPTQDWLKYYAEFFNTVEVNATFYRLPSPTLLQRWLTITPPEFIFSVKIWRRISHELRLKNIQSELQKFYESTLPLQPRIRVYLLQMPPSFVPNSTLLEEFLGNWSEIFKGGTLLAIELRNKKGFCEETYKVLRKYNVSLCLEDYKGCEMEDVITANWVYIRRHGPSGRYRGEYDIQQIQLEAKKIKGWLNKGMDVFVYFNNDFGGYAPRNAQQLIECLTSMKP